MKTYKYFFLLFILCITVGCATWQKSLSLQGDINSAIENVILDFIHTSNLFKKDMVFEIDIQEKEDIIIISIGGAVNKIYPRAQEIIGTYDESIPNRYFIYSDKLFYWSDPKEKISKDIIDILVQYNHIDFNWQSEYDLPPLVIDDGKDGSVYYICKSNYTNYKKTGANTIRKQYKVPSLKCD